MSKLKFLFLGGVFALVGIFNFSNATTYQISGIGQGSSRGYSPAFITLENSVDGFQDFDFDCDISGTSYSVCTISFHQVGCGDPQCNIEYDPSEGIVNSNSCSSTSFCAGNVNVVYSHKSSSYRTNFKSISFTDGFSDAFEMFGGGLVPAVDSLKITVYQIIPYVVYIGIGTLLVLLGFYAVRRLVNRIVKKINSIFKSKRG